MKMLLLLSADNDVTCRFLMKHTGWWGDGEGICAAQKKKEFRNHDLKINKGGGGGGVAVLC